MSKLRQAVMQRIGVVAYWASWPLNYLYLRGSHRSRVLLVAGGKVLLIKSWHGSGTWSLPGGGIHAHEEPIKSATRELMEETGIALGVDQLKPLATEPYKKHGLSFTCHYFIGRLNEVIEASPKLPEVIAAEWVPIRELPSYHLALDAATAIAHDTIE